MPLFSGLEEAPQHERHYEPFQPQALNPKAKPRTFVGLGFRVRVCFQASLQPLRAAKRVASVTAEVLSRVRWVVGSCGLGFISLFHSETYLHLPEPITITL